MFQKDKRISLLNYWTSRYLLTLFVGLAIISFISAVWIRHTTLENRLEMMKFLADETVFRLTDTTGSNNGPIGGIPGFIGNRERFSMREIDPILYVADVEGNVLTSNRPIPPGSAKNVAHLLEGEEGTKKIIEMNKGQETVQYVVKRKVESNQKLVGWVLVLEKKENLTKVNQAYGQLALLIGALALLGWGAIYLLSRRLAHPIKQVAEAAKQVQEGNYTVNLPENNKEEEIYELVTSFKEMANRLEQLEKTRTELLAGVTHELKTPVTSISGLLQAVRDGVVTGQDAKEFIQMALVETTKMKTMVGDLLAFNQFAVDAIPVRLETVNVNPLIRDAVTQWEVMQEEEAVKIHIQLLAQPVYVQADVVRMQQIITNLLTNARQAMQEGTVTISLLKKNDSVSITVRDTGHGIPQEEQAFIFERFFRGENKKYTIRGLGLGLSLSKMMAQSIGGDLRLIESNSSGTCFDLSLKKATTL
ncbi:sensor histidine kinase [Lysinibacillus pakistanensis]|uniref:histidine kinase n=1 Tax=Lysinibacillus pakistanensis TaxID=759811 RepID=A0AAX3WV96_9BACI|nr:HAMP domain-containing sensor histidine kinase [Lysinibacillus pakistanensis]MDM5231009.1 HAMP domain-containing sensor histidine kinase [Lysinibacillus pakistanensis]WHY46572.1 HAMP domain-containing sensor histidine kinase [Lysinibacillus pakistanensis]WHY51585.1 HAMP domain-containing sensor histidine kinase [Lysinibacillus pakistanensis]